MESVKNKTSGGAKKGRARRAPAAVRTASSRAAISPTLLLARPSAAEISTSTPGPAGVSGSETQRPAPVGPGLGAADPSVKAKMAARGGSLARRAKLLGG